MASRLSARHKVVGSTPPNTKCVRKCVTLLGKGVTWGGGGCWGGFFLQFFWGQKDIFFIWLSLLVVRDTHIPRRWATSWDTFEYPYHFHGHGLQIWMDSVFCRIVVVSIQCTKNHCALSFLFSWNILICICNFSLELHCIHCPNYIFLKWFADNWTIIISLEVQFLHLMATSQHFWNCKFALSPFVFCILIWVLT